MITNTTPVGTRVSTPLGPGSLAYVRMDPDTGYATVAAVSVKLDAKIAKFGYAGTTFPAVVVTELTL